MVLNLYCQKNRAFNIGEESFNEFCIFMWEHEYMKEAKLMLLLSVCTLQHAPKFLYPLSGS